MIANLIAFNLCWLANVLGAAKGYPWLGPMVTAVWVVIHFAVLDVRHQTNWRLVAVAAGFGYVADSLLVLSGHLAFTDVASLGYPSAVWMVALWIAFACTLDHSMQWLQRKWWLPPVFGAIGGPLAYFGGERLGALMPLAPLDLAWVGLVWLVGLPLLVALSKRLRLGSEFSTTTVSEQ
ncbi:MAG: DUF2878 domain-containing protein [Pseudomonadota bacterium]